MEPTSENYCENMLQRGVDVMRTRENDVECGSRKDLKFDEESEQFICEGCRKEAGQKVCYFCEENIATGTRPAITSKRIEPICDECQKLAAAFQYVHEHVTGTSRRMQ